MHQGCQVLFCTSRRNVGILWRCSSGQGPHIAMTRETRGFSRTPSALLPKFRASSPHPTSPFLPSHDGTGGGAPPALPAPPTAPTWSQARPLLTDPGASRPGIPAATSADRGGGEQTGVLPASDRGPLWSGRRKPPRISRTSLIAAAAARAVAVATGRICSHAPAPSQLPGGSGDALYPQDNLPGPSQPFLNLVQST